MVHKHAVGLATFVFAFLAISAHAQSTTTTEQPQTISVSGGSITTTYEDGTYIKIFEQSGTIPTPCGSFAQSCKTETIQVTLLLAGETQSVTTTVTNVQAGSIWLNPPLYTLVSYNIGSFTVISSSGRTVTVTDTTWTEKRFSRSGRGGGNFYVFQSGDQTISF